MPSKSYFNPALSNTPVQVFKGPCTIGYLNVENPGSAKTYLQLHDALAANVIPGTSVPHRSIMIPAVGAYDAIMNGPNSTALTIMATTTPTGNTAPATSLVINMDFYTL
jgi:hypothetical protein